MTRKIDPHKTDKDNPAWTAAMFKNAKQASDIFTPEQLSGLKKLRGKQKEPVKTPVSLRLDQLVVDHFKSQGKGWQTMINDILLKSIQPLAKKSRAVGKKVTPPKAITASAKKKPAAPMQGRRNPPSPSLNK